MRFCESGIDDMIVIHTNAMIHFFIIIYKYLLFIIMFFKDFEGFSGIFIDFGKF